MAVATLRRPRQGKQLLERAFVAPADRVDSENGVIYGAKICGLESRNLGRTIGLDPREFGGALDRTYRYSRTALESAAKTHYEGARIMIAHLESTVDSQGRRIASDRSRGMMEQVGEVRNCRMRDDGLYGDLHLLREHPRVPLILETARRMPDKIALSHMAHGVPTLGVDGRAVISKILSVQSVDLVSDRPATTNGLFEDHVNEHLVLTEQVAQLQEEVLELKLERMKSQVAKLVESAERTEPREWRPTLTQLKYA